MQPAEILCPNCRGGNQPGATQCRWCNAPLQAQQPLPPPSYTAQSYPAPQPSQQAAPQVKTTGRTFALAIGIVLSLIGACISAYLILTTVTGYDHGPPADIVTGTIILVAVTAICFGLPGVILLIVGLRKPKNL
jgi:hypothetical protein